MALALGTTTIIIIATTVGGTFVLAGLLGLSIFLTKRIRKRRQSARTQLNLTTGAIRWNSSNATYRQTLSPPISPSRLFRQPSQAVSLYPRQSWLHHGLLPSRQNSIKPSDWAVENGSHVPRPHRLKKSRSSIARNSALLKTITGENIQPVLPISEGNTTDDTEFRGVTYAVRSGKAQISTPSGKSQVLSMIVTPEHESHYEDGGPAQSTGSKALAALRRSQIFPSKSPSLFKSTSKKRSTSTPTSESIAKKRFLRSKSINFVSSSEPPSSAMPALPTPSTMAELQNMKKTRGLNNSPSKESFISRTTIGSSLIDLSVQACAIGISDKTLNRDRSNSRHLRQKRLSAPILGRREIGLGELEMDQVLGRTVSGASSQVLPSPFKPKIRKQKIRDEESGFFDTDPILPSDRFASRGSPEPPRLRGRDTPITLSGLSADWNVFGYDEQLKALIAATKNAQPQLPAPQLAYNKTTAIPQRPQTSQARKPRVLQKKWTKQESYSPLTFATVAYSSVVSLDTPSGLSQDIPVPSSIYSILVEEPNWEIIKRSSVISCPTSPSPGADHVQHDGINSQGPPRYPAQGLYGPRRMPSTTLQISAPAPVFPIAQTIKRPESRSSCTRNMSHGPRPSRPFETETTDRNKKRYQFDDYSSSDEDQSIAKEMSKVSPENGNLKDSFNVDPPPVRLDPTPSRRTFYGYEAVPSYMPHSSSILMPKNQNRSEIAGGKATRSTSASGAAGSRPNSSISNGFRISASYPAGSLRSKIGDSSGPTDTAVPPRSKLSSDPAHHSSRAATHKTSDFNMHDRNQSVSELSTQSQEENASATSATPLKNYSDVCDMFPRPLSVASSSRSSVWLPASNAPTASRPTSGSTAVTQGQMHPPSSKVAPMGLPSNPRCFIEQRSSGSSVDTASTPRSRSRAGTRATRPIHSTTGKHSPLRRSLARTMVYKSGIGAMAAASSQSAPEAPSAISKHLATPQAGTPLSLQTVSSLRHTDSASKDSHDQSTIHEKVLGPISVNIGSPIPFISNKSNRNKTPERHREMSPSPSPRGSEGRVQKANLITISPASSKTSPRIKSPFGAIGQERKSKTEISRADIFSGVQPANVQLKRRIEEAKQRKAQATQQTGNATDTAVHQHASIFNSLPSAGLRISFFDPKSASAQTTSLRTVATKAPSNHVIAIEAVNTSAVKDNSAAPPAMNRDTVLGKTAASNPKSILTSTKRKADSSSETEFNGANINDNKTNPWMASKRQRSLPHGGRTFALASDVTTEKRSTSAADGASIDSVPERIDMLLHDGHPQHRRVRFREHSQHIAGTAGNERSLYESDGEMSVHPGRLSNSPGRIWREEVF